MDVSERRRVADWIAQMDEQDFRQVEAIVEAAKRTRIENGTLVDVVELSRAVRARYPDADMIRVGVRDSDDVWCMAVGFYNANGERLAVEDYDARPGRPRTCQSEVEEAWVEGGRDAWVKVTGDDADDYPDEEVREVWLTPRG